jgi:glycerophosphoryl diester phosphodiesterase
VPPRYALVTILLTGALVAAAPSDALAQNLDIQAHRGGRGLMPENTLPAFANALALGVTTFELDCGITADGIVVIHHDPRLNADTARGPDGNWLAGKGPPIHALTYAELLRYDVGRLKPGTKYAAAQPQQRAVDGTRIPRLADLFDLVKRWDNSTVRFNIETKISPMEREETVDAESFAAALVDEIRKAGMEKRSTLQSFDWRTLKIAQSIAPEIPTVYLSAQQEWFDNIGAATPAGSAWTAGLNVREIGSVPKMVKLAGGAVWSPYFRDATPDLVHEAHSLGLTVVVWTVNSEPDMRALLSRESNSRVDGIISDRPDLLRRVAAEAGFALPSPSPAPAPAR